MYKYVQMPTGTHTRTHQPAAILVFVPTQLLCSVTGQLWIEEEEEEEEERKLESRIIYMHHSLGNRDQRTKRFLKYTYKYIFKLIPCSCKY